MTVKISKPALNIREELSDLKKPSGAAGEAVLRADTILEQAEILGLQPKRNLIINGDFQVWQRATTYTPGGTYGYFTADRWYSYTDSSTAQVETQSTDAPPGFQYSIKITAGGTFDNSVYNMHRYAMEPKELFTFNGKGGFTLQFWVKANNVGKYSVVALHNNSTQRQLSRSYYIEKPDTWEFKVLTFEEDTVSFDSNTTSFHLDWNYGKKTNASNGTFNDAQWLANVSADRQPSDQVDALSASGKTWQLAGVQLVTGQYSSGLPFAHRSYGEELALCQRYCYVIGEKVGSNSEAHVGTGNAYNASGHNVSIHLPVEMMKAPSITKLPASGNVLQFYVGASGQHASASDIQAVTDFSGTAVRLYVTGFSGLTAGQAAWVHTVSGAKLHLVAEIL